MTGALNFQSLAQLSAERILNCTAEGMVIALLAWLLLRAVGPRNSGTRFAVWFAALLGIAALPLFGNWTANGAELAKRSEITMPASWALYIFAGWLLMALAGLVRIGIGFWHLRRLRKSCVRVDFAALDPVVQKTLAEFDAPRGVDLCVSDQLRVPTAIGFTKPLVVIPGWTMRELSVAELNTILLHELAHLRRRDDWTNLIQKVLGALLFFHPAVWWIEKKLALEREMACDDMVLAEIETTNPRAYAECLVSLAERSFLRRGLALVQAAVDRLQNVALRVTQILDVSRPRSTRVWSPAPVLVSGVSLICLMALPYAPTRLVSFDSGAGSFSATNAAPASDFDATQMSQMGARVVPAKFKVAPRTPEEKSSAPMVAKPGPKSGPRPASRPDIIATSVAQHQEKAPKLVRAGMNGDGLGAQTLFFVTQTEFVQTRAYDASGAVVWDLCVWRVTVVGPVQNQLAGIAAKSI